MFTFYCCFIIIKVCIIQIYFSFYVFIIIRWFTIKFFINKFLFSSHILLYFSNISLILTKKMMYLLFLSQYLSYAFLSENFIHNSDGRAIPSNIYPVKYLYEPLLPYESFLTILFF